VVDRRGAEPRRERVDLIEVRARSPQVDEAARIWAEATAAGDGDEDVADLDVSRPLIAGVLDRSPRALLLTARASEGAAAGFAAVEPLGSTDENVAEIRYLGVRPGMWGHGVGGALLRALPERLRDAGFGRAVLSVYADNSRATALYERLGWRLSGAATSHRVTGQPERHCELRL
jgi:ribosomal protein S18 acetylase RimI-like enzyme